MTVARSINYTLRMFTQAESEMTSVERVLHFAYSLPTEDYGWAGCGKHLSSIPSNIPAGEEGRTGHDKQQGPPSVSVIAHAHGGTARGAELEMDSVSMRYRPGLPLVLQRVSFRVGAGSRVGVVGRTGAGKSSLIHALLRLVDLGTHTCTRARTYALTHARLQRE